ncbi:GntR family transcriptional regulator [Desertimonas flava]|uniref:GntR family transcriptional regulator n=1 Tax=Desertimonas flava TaxID=2064846 RepID=UPI000E34E0DE|nr:GntR family transcriptional regulator [Desertimonas flava]
MSDRAGPGAGTELPGEPVYERLRAGIVEGRYAPGARLVEQAIAAELGVSRTPVREALRRLESDGLVTSERNRGVVVRSISAAEIDDLYELRGRLESYAAELAAGRRTAEQLAALHAAAAEFSAAVEQVAAARRRGVQGSVAQTRALNAANRRFHDTVVAAAAHDRLGALLAGTVDVPLVFRALRDFDGDQLQRSALFHHLIVEAVSTGDGTRAGRLMAEHIAQGHDMVRDGLAAEARSSGQGG